MVTGVPHGVPRPDSSGRGVCNRLAGNVMGRRPEGFTLPVSTSAIARPPACPGYHAWTMALTLSRHGIDDSVLPPWQREVCKIEAFALDANAEGDHHVRALRQEHRLRWRIAGVELDLRVRKVFF